MFKNGTVLLSILNYLIINLCVATSALATPSDALVSAIGDSVLRVQVKLDNGKQGLGSAVVIAKDTVITNCHVVNNASQITVIEKGVAHIATTLKTDMRHDLCLLKVEDLQAPIIHMGSSKNLKHEASLFSVGYPDKTTSPVTTYGVVKGLFPMDGSMVIRASTPFRPGASGGGAFDDAGNLIGVITLKSKGSNAYYYYMPVEWAQELMQSHKQNLVKDGNHSLEVVKEAINQKPFWASAEKERPYFMRVVHPFQNEEWDNLQSLAEEWVAREPDTAESWFFLAAAEFAKNDYANAQSHFKHVLNLNKSHVEAIEYLSKISLRLNNVNLTLN